MEWWNQISHWWFWVSDYFSYPYAIQEDIQIMSDSSTVIPYINNMVGSRSIILRSSLWSTQIWLPAVLRLVVLTPIIINSSHLPLPGTKQRQPLYQQIKLTAFLLPKDTSKHITILGQSRQSYWHHGEICFVVKGRLTHFNQM